MLCLRGRAGAEHWFKEGMLEIMERQPEADLFYRLKRAKGLELLLGTIRFKSGQYPTLSTGDTGQLQGYNIPTGIDY